MKRYLMVFGFGLVILGGCSTTYEVPRDARTDEFIEARERMWGTDVMVILNDSTKLELTSATLLDDTILGRDQISGNIQAIPLGKVSTVRAYDVWRGVGRGALQGMIILGGLGLAVGAAALGFYPRDYGVVAAATAGGALEGVVLGGLIGAVAFSPYDYEFHPARGEVLPARGEVLPARGEVLEHQPPPVPPLRLSQSITLRLTGFQDETPGAVCIAYRGKLIWLLKSEIKIERDGEYILLTIPEKLLQQN